MKLTRIAVIGLLFGSALSAHAAKGNDKLQDNAQAERLKEVFLSPPVASTFRSIFVHCDEPGVEFKKLELVAYCKMLRNGGCYKGVCYEGLVRMKEEVLIIPSMN